MRSRRLCLAILIACGLVVLGASPAAAQCFIALNPTTVPAGTVGVAYTATLTASNGVPPETFEIISGSLPPGITPSTTATTATLSGTPTTAGTYPFTVRASDIECSPAVQAYSLVINPAAPAFPGSIALLFGAGLLGLGYLRLRRKAAR